MGQHLRARLIQGQSSNAPIESAVECPYIKNRSEPVWCQMTLTDIVLVRDQRPKRILPVTYLRSERGQNTQVMARFVDKRKQTLQGLLTER